ncbi:hypothetical protein WMY93_026428 [Mugilogobius chulae]|uniref:C2H2-type domain-containing protein n=1 Tax=Mugilogobius chulae TaxID=88201 RepID=A0AAW0N483_9GOBI
MSVPQSDSGKPALPDFSRMTEDEQIAYALQMSMQGADEFGAEGMDTGDPLDSTEVKEEEDYDVMQDPEFLQSVLESLPGVDPKINPSPVDDEICARPCRKSPSKLQVLIVLEMGDMKTPDFDDLLAAFDIPDMEAIESSPEEEENNNSETEEGSPGGKDKMTNPNSADQTDVPASDEEDSEPDFDGALVIQESPQSPESAALPSKKAKLKHKTDANLDFSNSSEMPSNSPQTAASRLNSSELKTDPQISSHLLPSPPPLIKDEKYPEHVIDERESPESPPPSETGMLVPQKTDSECIEQPKESEVSREETSRVTEEAKTETGDISTDPPALGPIKVKMKRSARIAVTRAASRKSGRTKTEAVKALKTLPECDTRPRRKSLKQAAAVQDAETVKGAKLKLSSAPSISSKTTAKVTPAGITLRSLGQKTLPAGMNLPLPSLLPPLTGSSRPASIVNNTGAIISKSQTNLVEAFNRILNNKNLLPSYKPDLASSRQAEWGLSLPAQGYKCLECGDSFALEQSLARHYDRRSLRIEVTCNHCAKRLAFFNKCSLLLHAREHKEKGLIMQCSHLVMKPVPVEQMIGPQEPAAAALSSVLSHTPFSSAEEVARHFQELKSSQTITCTECSPPMLLSNSCCVNAHHRIHLNLAPHVCPDCGVTAKPHQFKTHLEEICLHFARRIGYKCSSCLVVFGGINSVKSHIQQAHCDVFQKCPLCPMAFKSELSIQAHVNAKHPTLTNPQAVSIFKCVMCDTVFTNKNLLHIHFDTHLANQKVHVFKCPECPKQFSVRSSLMDHIKTHQTKVKQESPFTLTQPSVKIESSEGEEWILPGKEETQKKIRKQFPCNKCDGFFSTTSNLRRHIRDKHKPVARGFRCQFCTDVKKSFSSRAMLEKHIKLRHSRETQDQDFLMLPETLPAVSTLEGNIIEVIHDYKYLGRGDEADSSSEQDGSSVFRRRRRAAVKSEEPEDESANEVSPMKKWRQSSALTSDPQTERGFRCAPCGYTCEDQAEFLEHISQHRKGPGGSSQQCLQCGVCFTSNHSLSRHRFIVHKVRNQEDANSLCPVPSLNENHEDKGIFSALELPALSQGKDAESALACKVCGKQFEKATDLNTHFRTHGMAFINARNTGKTT